MTGVDAFVAQYGVGLVFVATLAARLGAPVPAAPFVVVAGGLSAGGALSIVQVIVFATIASMLGDGAWYLAGRRYGYRILRMLCRISMSPDSCVRQSESLIGKWGGSALIGAKFLPGLSVVAAPMTGALGMTGREFLGFELIASLVWSLAFAYLGVVFSHDINRVLESISNLGVGTALVLSIVAVAYLAMRYVRRRASMRDQSIPRISVDDLAGLLNTGEEVLIVDVRSTGAVELDARRIPGAVPVELKRIRQWAESLPRERHIVLYCNCPNEASAARASRVLIDHGFVRARPLAGGLEEWVKSGRHVDVHPGAHPQPPADEVVDSFGTSRYGP
jgi:membrane protein DedA with SNARE-associated domain/rhodanese-related sulfurtransferase